MKPSIKTFATLDGMLDFINRKYVDSFRKKGSYCLKMLRRRDGSRVIFEEMNGVLIDKFETYDSNTVVVYQRSHGKVFQYHKEGLLQVDQRAIFDARIFLQDLAMINVYDYSIEFLTVEGIDFVCLVKDRSASMSILSDWIDDQQGILRVQWVRDREAEEILDGVGPDKIIELLAPNTRNVDLTGLPQQKRKMKIASYLNRNLDL